MHSIRKYPAAVAVLMGLGVVGAVATHPMPLRTLPEALLGIQGDSFVVRVPEDYLTIQAAVDAATEGATVLIGPGVYKENVQVRKSLRLVGAGQEQVQIQAADDSKPIIHVFSKAPVQVYFQGLTLGDPTTTIEQLLLIPPIRPLPYPFLPPRTGLYVDGPIQTLVRKVTVGGQQEVGIWATHSFPNDGIYLFSFQPLIILEEVRLVRNGIGLGLIMVQGLILRSVIEDNVGGVFGGGTALLHQNVVRGNRHVGLFLFVRDQGLVGEIRNNEITQNGIGIYLSAKGEGSRVEISENRFVQNRQYAIVVQDPTCPFVTGEALPTLLQASAQIQILGAINEFRDNGKGDLCPADYPWPPGFRK